MTPELISTMIVEDEEFILKDFLSIINWEESGFRIVATALNGIQGIKKFEQYRPQLVITDIKMPGLDGLDMIRSIKNQSENTRFIVITSFSDFDYAQTALRLGAEDYILKSEITEDYILGKLNSLKDRVLFQTNITVKSIEKQILDVVKSEISHDFREKLHNIIALIPNSLSTTQQIIDFSVEQVRREYAILNIEDHFSVPSLNTTAELERWLSDSIHEFNQLKNMISDNRFSATLIKAIDYINQNYSNPNLSISDIAEYANISVSRLCVICKKEANKTLKDIITEKRINEAKKLLYLDNLKVYEVADRVGYKNGQYFSKIFYQQTGQHPNDCRKQHPNQV